MQYTLKDLPKSQKEAKVTVEAAEAKPFMERAATSLSEKVKIEGFRPGKADYQTVVRRVGEMAVLEEALPRIVQKYLLEILKKENLDTVGEPSINVEKAAPGNELVFTATMTLLPAVKKLADYKGIKVDAKKVEVKDADIEKTVADLRKMQSTEHAVEREVAKGDKVVVDMAMTIDKVPVEGGTTKGHSIYLDEEYYIPGLPEKLMGMKKGEQRVFTLTFPKDHFNKLMAGKEVEFTVDLKGVHEIRHPDVDDAFAQRLGQKDLASLKELLRKNMEQEGEMKETQRQEVAALEELLKKSDVDDVPDLLVNNECHKMMHELEDSIARQGLQFSDYLASIKKTQKDLLLDFAPEAAKRVKTMVLMRAIGKAENIEPADMEVLEEQTRLLNMYKDDPATQERVRSEEGLDYIRSMVKNRMILKFIRETMVKK
jgi:trigger factor